MCLAQGHNAVTLVRLEPAAAWSRVKHSTSEPLHFLIHVNGIIHSAPLNCGLFMLRTKKVGLLEKYWAGIQHNVQVSLCLQRRFKLVCTFTQSDQSLNFLNEEMLDPWLPMEDLSDCVDAQADLSLLGCKFAHVNLYKGLVATKPVFGFSDKLRFTPACLATETS